MVNRLVLKHRPVARPLTGWGHISTELLGTQTRFVQGERWRHRVIECGDGGEPLFLLHGIGGHAETYCRNLRNLAASGFHVYAVDTLYHGFTSSRPRVEFAQRIATQADALADLLRALGHDRVHVEGESMGADIAFEFGARYPELAGRIVLNTGFPPLRARRTGFRKQPGGGATLKTLSQESVTSGSFEIMRKRMEWLVARPDRMTDEMVEMRLRLYAEPDINDAMRYIYRIGEEWAPPPARDEDDIRDFKPETLVFWTEHNPGQGPDYGEYVADLLPNGTFYCMSDAGHWPQWEKPEEHDQVLIEYVLGR